MPGVRGRGGISPVLWFTSFVAPASRRQFFGFFKPQNGRRDAGATKSCAPWRWSICVTFFACRRRFHRESPAKTTDEENLSSGGEREIRCTVRARRAAGVASRGFPHRGGRRCLRDFVAACLAALGRAHRTVARERPPGH